MKQPTALRAVSFSAFAGIFTAAYTALDMAILRRGVVPSVSYYAVVGGVLLLGVTGILGKILSPWIDPEFRGYKQRWALNPWVIATAAAGAMLTVTFLQTLKVIGDPSIVVPVEQSVVLVLLAWDWIET